MKRLPIRTARPATSVQRGPPESPWQASCRELVVSWYPPVHHHHHHHHCWCPPVHQGWCSCSWNCCLNFHVTPLMNLSWRILWVHLLKLITLNNMIIFIYFQLSTRISFPSTWIPSIPCPLLSQVWWTQCLFRTRYNPWLVTEAFDKWIKRLSLLAVFSSRVLSFQSVVDVSDIDRVDERCAQLLPDVHNQLIPKIIFRHIPHLSKGKELKKYCGS